MSKEKIVVHLVGLNCWKCHSSIGALCIPQDSETTPDSFIKLLVAKRILPICDKCTIENPSYVQTFN